MDDNDAQLQLMAEAQLEGDKDPEAYAEPTDEVESDGSDSFVSASPAAFLVSNASIKVPNPTGSAKSMAQKAIEWATTKIGSKETPRYSNIIFAWDDVYPDWQGQPWCAAFVTDAWARQGVDFRKFISNPYYCPNLEDFFKTWGAWMPNNGKYSPVTGDVSLMGRGSIATHTGLAAPSSENYNGYRQIEGNTSSSYSGSQTNGDGCYRRDRSSGFIRGWGAMQVLIPKLVKAGKLSAPISGGGSSTLIPFSMSALMVGITGSKKGQFNGNVRIVQGLLKAQGLIGFTPNGKWDKWTAAGYSKYQVACGYKGKDADGIPGKTTMNRLLSWSKKYRLVK